MTTIEVTNAQVITVLKHLANGRQPDFAATVTHLPQSAVERIAEDHGWPDMDKVRAGIFELTKAELDTPKAATASPPAVARPAAPTPPAGRPDLSIAQKAPTPPAATPDRPRTANSSAAELLHMATESDHARTRNLGTKISGLLADLSQRLNDEEAERLARAAAKAEETKRARRIAELEAELAQLKGKKAPAPRAATASGEKRTNVLPRGEFPCTRCDRVLDTTQGRAAHERRAHDGFNPATSKSA